MTGATITIERTGKGSDALLKSLERVAKSAVYVGIAEGSSTDSRDEAGISNSMLGLIHEHGSPIRNIPARPFLVPGVAGSKKVISSGFQKALKEALKGRADVCEALLDQTGQRVRDAVKKYLTTADFVPLQTETIMNRKRVKAAKGQKKLDLVSNARPLIDTAQLLNSIDSYVVKE